jgi:hypothetical protein
MVIRLAERDAEPERLEQQSSSLRRELVELDVDDVTMRGEGVPPEGSRGIGLVAVGELLVAMQGSLEILKPVIETVRAWVARGQGEQQRTAELMVGDKAIKLTGVSADRWARRIPVQLVASATSRVFGVSTSAILWGIACTPLVLVWW